MKVKQPIYFILCVLIIYCISESYGNNNNDSIRAIATYNSGVNFLSNAQFQNAIDSFSISSQLRERLYSKISYEYGIAQNALGVTFKNLGDLNKSLDFFLRAELAYLSNYNDNQLTIARLYNNIGNVYKSKFDFGSAIDYFQRAIDIYKVQEDDNYQDIADFYYNIADIKFLQQNYEEALQIINNYKQNAYPDTKLYFMFLQAIVYQELNQYDKANTIYLEALNYAKNLYSENDINLVYDYLNYSNFLIQQNNLEKAEININLAKEILDNNKTENGTLVSFLYKTIGYLQSSQPIETKDLNDFRNKKTFNYKNAIRYYHKALEALGVKFGNIHDIQNSEQTTSFTQSIELLKLIADNYVLIFDINSETTDTLKHESINKALEYYEVTSNLIQQARKEIYSDENKIQLSVLEEATFRKIVQTAYKAYDMKERQDIAELAFTNAERMKASSVFDRLSDQFAKENSLIPDSITDLERILNYNITYQNEKLFNLKNDGDPDNKEIAKTDSTLFQLKKQRDELNKYLEDNFSDYFELKYANTTASMADIKQSLKRDEVLIEYVLNESDSIPELYAFLLSNEKIAFNKIPINKDFLNALESTFRFMANPEYLFTRNINSKTFCANSYKLYEKLIAPFSDNLKNKRITIIPDGILNYLPFDALFTEMPDTSGVISFNRLPYFIKTNSVNYSYSAGMLIRHSRKRKTAPNSLIAFAPLYNSDTIVFDNDKLVLTPLPGTQTEVELISKEVKTRLYKNENATEINFRTHSKDFDILHLAMHAFINDSLPAFSRFAFSQNSGNMPENDGWLNTADIYNLDLKARLTVLSACNTGTGKLQNGEGLMSLARGFIYAGCPNIIMTMWEVEDNAGTEIMSSFYKNLKKGKTTSEALRQAKLNYLENANPRMAHPHYWLGFVSIGNEPSLFRSYDFYFIGLIILIFVAITAEKYISYQKARKKKFN